MGKELSDYLSEFTKKKILVVGDILLDKFTRGEVERINPEQPAAHLVRIKNEDYALGGAGNVANNISALGAECFLYGILGRDQSGKTVEKLCVNKGIKLRASYDENPTIVKQRIIAHRQQMIRLDFGEGEKRSISEEAIEEIGLSILKSLEDNPYDFVILSDYNKGFFGSGKLPYKIRSFLEDKGIPILASPKPKNIVSFVGCEVLCLNKKEAEETTGISYNNIDDVLTKIGKEIARKTCSKYVVITCGEDGMFSYDHTSEKSIFIPTKAREVADVTGAGDTFAATLALGLSCKLNIHDAAVIANYAAGIVVGKVGTATTTLRELRDYIKKP